MSRVSEVTLVHVAALDNHLSSSRYAGQGFPKRQPCDQGHLRIRFKLLGLMSRSPVPPQTLGIWV